MTHDGEVVLGVDGGGTKTLVAVADREANVHLLHRVPTVDPFADPAWPDALGRAFAAIEPLRGQLAYAVLGLPCHGESARLSLRQREAAQRLLRGPHEVINDVEAAFDGALAGRPGVLLLAGTGSMAWAGDGETSQRCGGWGEWFGDEGSAFWIGREALAEASRAIDGRSQCRAFAERLLDLLGVEPGDLLDWCFNLAARRTAIAALAFDVDTLAESGQITACRILAQAGDALAAHAEASARRLDLRPGFAWSHAGSVFNSRTVMAQVTKRLGTQPDRPRLPPVGGALLRAARGAGWPIDEIWVRRLDKALTEQKQAVEAVAWGEVR